MMHSIVIDELLSSEIEAMKEYLQAHTAAGSICGIYWLTLGQELWAPSQLKAQHDQPHDELSFRMAIEVCPTLVRFELLVRGECIKNIGGGLANRAQTIFVLNFIEEMTRGIAPGPRLGRISRTPPKKA